MIRFLQTPGKTKKIVLGGLLLLICAAMVITLIPGFMDTGSSESRAGVVASVAGQDITSNEALEDTQQMARQQQLPPQFARLLTRQVVESLIMRKAELAEAGRLGLRVSDDEVRTFLQTGPLAQVLYPNGKPISEAEYENFVQQQFNLSVVQFEQEVRDQILLGKLRDLVEGPVAVSDNEVRQEYERRNTKVKFDYALLTQAAVEKEITPAEAELKAFYDKNQNSYKNAIPEMRKAQYVVIDPSALKSDPAAQVSEDEMKRYYNQHMDEYRVPDQVLVRHILIKTPEPEANGQVDQKAVDAARAEAQEVLDKLKAGTNFSDLAKKYSQDTGSAQNGGSIGWITRGRTVPEFEKVAFSLAKGATSGIVQTSYGFHIIHVDDTQAAHVKPFNEVKDQIASLLGADKVERAADSLAATLQSEARTQGLGKAAAQHNLRLESAGPFTRNDTLPGVGPSPEVMSAAFAAHFDPREKNSTPENVRIPTGYVVLQVTDVVPPATPTFEQARAKVEADFKRERAASLLVTKLQQLADRAHAEHDLKKAAAEVGATVKASELVSPQDQVPDIGSMSGPAAVVFSMKPGEISAPINTGTGGVVVALLDKEAPPAEGFDKDKEQIRQQLVMHKRDQMMQLFAANLRQKMQKEGKIRINQQELERLSPTTPPETGE